MLLDNRVDAAGVFCSYLSPFTFTDYEITHGTDEDTPDPYET